MIQLAVLKRRVKLTSECMKRVKKTVKCQGKIREKSGNLELKISDNPEYGIIN